MADTSELQAGALRVVDRRNREIFEEKVLGGSWMSLAYDSALHPLLKYTLFNSGLASRVLGWYTRRPISRKRIRPTIESLGIDTSEFLDPVDSFRSFHEFFVRRLKPELRPFDQDSSVFCSPADSRLSLIPDLGADFEIPIKSQFLTIEGLTRRLDMEKFNGGLALIFRLCPADYHRYHFPTDGKIIEQWEISGRYDSVHPTALKLGLPIFTENRRVVSLLELQNFGPALFVEVGAFGVGGIVETHREPEFRKGEEKGYFQYGASTLILILEKGRLLPDPDLMEFSEQGLECLVRAGERLGTAPDSGI